MNRMIALTVSIAVCALLLATPVFGHPQSSMSEHHGMMAPGDMAHGAMNRKEKGHHFAQPWAETLSDAQKSAIDRMHHDLERELVVLKARAELAEKELNAYTISDDANTGTINKKIDQLLAIKKQIMVKRYAHLLEMRKSLTDEQRISYDMAVLKRHGIK